MRSGKSADYAIAIRPTKLCGKTKRRPKGLRFLLLAPCFIRFSPQPSRRVGEQGVDEAGLRGELGPQRLRSALVAGDLVEQPLELGDIAVDRLLEAAVGAIFAGDLVECLLAGRGIEP